MFERPFHQNIAWILGLLDSTMLRENACLFGGGTAIALLYGEYRESVDMDFLVSDVTRYRYLRQQLTSSEGIASIVRKGAEPLLRAHEIRADQYGIRTMVQVAGQAIKFEIVLEGRMELDPPQTGDEVCGVATLTRLDLAASKLLANADRWNDEGVFNRGLIDLAMMQPSLPLLRRAVTKAETAYGEAISRDLAKALEKMKQRHGWLERCMEAMAIRLPKAVVWQRLRRLNRVLHPVTIFPD